VAERRLRTSEGVADPQLDFHFWVDSYENQGLVEFEAQAFKIVDD